ncbi:hypothetical protein [Paenibacillus farraposensis]|uniref:hypothetical protein n=1 Tax=Paenibacillus farraposensis TaxID=2807095 RepID=UPI003672AE84
MKPKIRESNKYKLSGFLRQINLKKYYKHQKKRKDNPIFSIILFEHMFATHHHLDGFPIDEQSADGVMSKRAGAEAELTKLAHIINLSSITPTDSPNPG